MLSKTAPSALFIARICLLLPLQAPALVFAQTENPEAAEQLENFFRDNEQATESDAQMLLEQLENLRAKPLDLNRCTREDLSGLRLLNELQLENFLQYRATLGPFLNELELQAVPGWELDDIRKVLEFSKIDAGLDTRSVRIRDGFATGDDELLLRWGRPDPPRFGTGFDTGDVEGAPNAWAMRYRHSFDNRLRFGFTLENDPGEALFKGSNRAGFDFYSAHLFAQNLNPTIRTLALGDYSARFGQGLLLQTGFSPGKSAETTVVTRGGRKLNAYAAFGEAFFFRGAATTVALGKHLEITALYSNRRRDGNIVQDTSDQEFPELQFSSLQSSGLHRTSNEISDEKALREQVGGLSAAYLFQSGQISVNALHLRYERPWNPDAAAYRQFVFRGDRLTGLSVDYNWKYRNWMLFGETARSDNGAVATVNGLLLAPDRHVTLSAVHRRLPRDYQSVYAAPFAEVTGASNEQGLYLGADIRFIRRLQVNLYADVWRHPWLRFGVDAPSQGREYLARINWTKSRQFSAYLLLQSEVKERNSDAEDVAGLVENRRDRIRLHAIYKVSKTLEFRNRIEWTTFKVGDGDRAQGYIAFQEAVWKPLGFPLSGTIRYAVFDTDNFDTRVFAYENDLFSAVSIPAFSGRGVRYYTNLQWRVNPWLRLEMRLEETVRRKAVTDSGRTGRERFWKVQARIKL
jgi:hypothetical protein